MRNKRKEYWERNVLKNIEFKNKKMVKDRAEQNKGRKIKIIQTLYEIPEKKVVIEGK